MADIHILAGDGRKHWRVAFHLDVPDAMNDAGVNYRRALVNSGLISLSVMPEGDGSKGTIEVFDRLALAEGALWEHVESIRGDTHGQTAQSQRTALKLAYARAELDVLKRLKRKLKYFGHAETR